jgi:hypothetical protein
LSSENAQLRDIQQKLQSRLNSLEAATSASTIAEASAAASLSYANRLAVEMARVTDMHIKSLEKLRGAATTNLPHLKNVKPLSPMLQSVYDTLPSPKRLSVPRRPSEEANVKIMEDRIKQLENTLNQGNEEMGEVVRKMQVAQIEMIELAGERDEALRREKKVFNDSSRVHVIDSATEINN